MNEHGPNWHSRGYLPHFDSNNHVQSITFRLADSLPTAALEALKTELTKAPETEREKTRRRLIEKWLDSGQGCCALAHPGMAKIMQDTLLHYDKQRYHMIAWCVMPNHVHVMIGPTAPISQIVQSWKGYTGYWAKQHAEDIGLKSAGRFWMRDYWDRYIRNEHHFHQTMRYIHRNPVKAGLCSDPKDWQWSSACRYR
ncbi:REP-associated tyrosine transposase [Sulfuriroseicoccus oceanibius]|uniref:Transposase n=1 Tax=Sulfuriroseicoccus oceanibius TaxID=2707525 RepID=A0A6B3L2V3_9BACT|nr:transposase [Sulfuriroseicoccus oceanibius]QQL44279.1 transposase [Sulfuriroseicoccus oceanibius]